MKRFEVFTYSVAAILFMLCIITLEALIVFKVLSRFGVPQFGKKENKKSIQNQYMTNWKDVKKAIDAELKRTEDGVWAKEVPSFDRMNVSPKAPGIFPEPRNMANSKPNP